MSGRLIIVVGGQFGSRPRVKELRLGIWPPIEALCW